MLPMPNPVIAALSAYDPGHDLESLRRSAEPHRLVELGSNENAFGPCAGALEIVRGSSATDLLRYPDPQGHGLKTAIATHHGVAPAEVVIGNGSHELLMLLAQAFAGIGDEVAYSEFAFAVYAIAARSVGASGIVAAALAADHESAPRGHDLEALACAVSKRTRLIYVANPNNPTGTAFAAAQFADFMERIPPAVLVVVDEAYVDYAADPVAASVLALRARFANLVVTRTFSKIHALAGLRVGYAIAHSDVASVLDRLRETFNINALAQQAARAALADALHVQSCRMRNLQQRQALIAALRALGMKVPESHGNFVLVEFPGGPSQTREVEESLLAQHVVLRPMHGYGLPQCLRITVGTQHEQARLVDALKVALT